MFGPPQRLWLIGSGQLTAGEIFANGHEFLVFSSGLLSKVPLPPLLVEIQGFQGITARLWRSIILEQNLQRSLAKRGDRYVCSVQNARVAAHAKCLCARNIARTYLQFAFRRREDIIQSPLVGVCALMISRYVQFKTCRWRCQS